MSASHNSPVLLRFCTGLRTGDRLIVDQEVVGSNPAPSIDCLATPLQRSQTVPSFGPTSQAFLSTDVDSTDKKNFVAGLKDTLCGVLRRYSFERPAAVKFVVGSCQVLCVPRGTLVFSRPAAVKLVTGVGKHSAHYMAQLQCQTVAVSNHSNTPSAARCVETQEGAVGEFQGVDK